MGEGGVLVAKKKKKNEWNRKAGQAFQMEEKLGVRELGGSKPNERTG